MDEFQVNDDVSVKGYWDTQVFGKQEDMWNYEGTKIYEILKIEQE